MYQNEFEERIEAAGFEIYDSNSFVLDGTYSYMPAEDFLRRLNTLDDKRYGVHRSGSTYYLRALNMGMYARFTGAGAEDTSTIAHLGWRIKNKIKRVIG